MHELAAVLACSDRRYLRKNTAMRIGQDSLKPLPISSSATAACRVAWGIRHEVHRPLVTFTTDFGLSGLVCRNHERRGPRHCAPNPGRRHLAFRPGRNIRAGGLRPALCLPLLSQSTVHVAVVDRASGDPPAVNPVPHQGLHLRGTRQRCVIVGRSTASNSFGPIRWTTHNTFCHG